MQTRISNGQFSGPEYRKKDSGKESPDELNEIVKTIETCSTEILTLNQYSEHDFLSIASKLQSFLSASKELSASSSQIASTITENLLKEGITELSRLLRQFSGQLSKSAEDIKKEIVGLLDILIKIELITDNVGNFKKIAKQMRMLCISTKIESSRLGTDDRGFNILAENVEKLSNFISDKAQAIFVKATQLMREIQQSVSKLENLEKEQRFQSEIILSNTNLTLDTFEQQYNEASVKADEISVSSKDVLNSINEIVISIQFHDINRQKMEHASEALTRLSHDTTNGVMENGETIEISDKYGLILDVCELQIIQLQNALDEFVSAVLNIIRNLQNVENDVDDIFQEITHVIGENTIFNKGSLNEVKSELAAISKGLDKNAEIGKEIAGSIQTVVLIIDELTTDILEIEEVGTEIELIALNAILKAARTGKEGAALGVLAESIQRLSLDAKSHTSLSSKILESIGGISETLRSTIEAYSQTTTDENSLSANTKTAEILDSIDHVGTTAGGVLQALSAKVDQLKKDITTTCSMITIHEKIQSAIVGIISELHTITENISKTNVLKSNRKLHTEELLKRYTMHSERILHRRFTGHIAAGVQAAKKANEADDLVSFDNNIELFSGETLCMN